MTQEPQPYETLPLSGLQQGRMKAPAEEDSERAGIASEGQVEVAQPSHTHRESGVDGMVLGAKLLVGQVVTRL